MIDIGYKFKDITLLRRALTHSSAVGGRGQHSELLELLGDSVLDLYTCAKLLAVMDDARDGAISMRRAQLICEPALAAVAKRAGIDRALIVGKNVVPTTRMLADAFEAVCGAAYLDGGLQAVKTIDNHVGIVP